MPLSSYHCYDRQHKAPIGNLETYTECVTWKLRGGGLPGEYPVGISERSERNISLMLCIRHNIHPAQSKCTITTELTVDFVAL